MTQFDPWAVTVTSPVLPPPRPAPTWPRDVAQGAAVALVLILLAGPLGLLWGHVAPRAALLVVAEGGQTIGNNPHDATAVAAESMIAGDALFLIITVIAGMLCGFLAWLLLPRAGAWVAAGLAVGGLCAAFIAVEVGRMITHQAMDPTINRIKLPAHEHVRYHFAPLWHGSVVAWALSAVVVFFLLVLAFDARGARRASR